MADTVVTGYVDVWGKHAAGPVDHVGPASYSTGGETITGSYYGLRSLDYVGGGVSESGTYFVLGGPTAGGLRATQKLLWFIASSGAEVGEGTDLSAETVRILVVGG